MTSVSAAADPSDSLLVRAARRQHVERTPVWFMRQAGRSLPEYRELREGVPMLEACRTPDLVAEITMQPVRRHGVDAAIFFSDIVVPLAAVGVDLDIVPGTGPVVAKSVRQRADPVVVFHVDVNDRPRAGHQRQQLTGDGIARSIARVDDPDAMPPDVAREAGERGEARRCVHEPHRTPGPSRQRRPETATADGRATGRSTVGSERGRPARIAPKALTIPLTVRVSQERRARSAAARSRSSPRIRCW